MWTRYVTPTCWPTWSPQIRAVDYPYAELTAGTTGIVHGPCGLAAPFEILTVDVERRRWSWRVRPPVIGELILVHGVEPAGSGTRTTLGVTGPDLVVPAYLPVARLALRRLVR